MIVITVHDIDKINVHDTVTFTSVPDPTSCPRISGSHLFANISDTSLNVVVKVTCETGYVVSGNTVLVCQNGVWSPAVPTCVTAAASTGSGELCLHPNQWYQRESSSVICVNQSMVLVKINWCHLC